MNLGYISKQLYRIRIAGPRKFSADVYQFLRRSRSARESTDDFFVIGDPNGSVRVLYVHSGWAIRNVGLLWFAEGNGVRCTMTSIERFLSDPSIQSDHDIVFFGYSELLLRGQALVKNRLTWCAIHDPIELFPERYDWVNLGPKADMISAVQRVNRLFVTTFEMWEQLQRCGLDCTVIPTDSNLPLRSLEELNIAPEQVLRVVTVGRIYRRKNFELFNEIQKAASREFGRKIDFYSKLAYMPIPERDYIRLLDSRAVYICTSFQEGGPIPPMDAMCRGELVLSTPVGQMPQRIYDGHNGYLCRTSAEFIDKLRHLVSSPSLVLSMRRNAIVACKRFRTESTVALAVREAFRPW